MRNCLLFFAKPSIKDAPLRHHIISGAQQMLIIMAKEENKDERKDEDGAGDGKK